MRKLSFKLGLLAGFFAVLIITFSGFFQLGGAVPPLPYILAGQAHSDGNLLKKGSVIKAVGSQGMVCGSYTVIKDGEYGPLYIEGDDPGTEEKEGCISGEVVNFLYNGSYAQENITWSSGRYNYSFDLNFNRMEGHGELNKTQNESEPCTDCDGDGFNLTEDCNDNNPEIYPGKAEICNGVDDDCNGLVDDGINCGGASSGDNGGSVKETTKEKEQKQEEQVGEEVKEEKKCVEDWTCSDWGACIEGLQNRTCTDKNKCGTEKNKPRESRICGCRPNWVCKPWSKCVSGVQDRTCVDWNQCKNDSFNKKTEERKCTVETENLGVKPEEPTGKFAWNSNLISGLVLAFLLILLFIFFKWLR